MARLIAFRKQAEVNYYRAHANRLDADAVRAADRAQAERLIAESNAARHLADAIEAELKETV